MRAANLTPCEFLRFPLARHRPPLSESRPSPFLSYLRLFRLPNVFTAHADVLMGFLFVRPSLFPLSTSACLLIASSLIYTAGMVLNDVFDFDVDSRERPFRPLPSGQIDRRFAASLGFGMLLVGTLVAGLGGWLIDSTTALRSFGVASLLSICVVLYDWVLKKTPVAPLAMGSCRFLNVLLGMTAVTSTELLETRWRLADFDLSQIVVAAGIGVYIVGVTWFARNEARASNRAGLIAGTTVMVLGVGLLALFPNFGRIAEGAPLFVNKRIWPMGMLLLSLFLWRRCILAIASPTPDKVQAAVKLSIFSLILLDAAVCFAVRGPFWAIGIVGLLIPTLLLGKWVYST